MSEPTINDVFPVLVIDPNLSSSDEALGTKPKFWIERDKESWLFKYARENTGEDWSEKLSFEIANLLGIPAAYVELASANGKPGTLSRSFIDRRRNESLIHGNEILAGQVLGYDPSKKFKQSNHTLENIQHAIGRLFPSQPRQQEILGMLASYLILDALIGNGDRHHENWGLLSRPRIVESKMIGFELEVAPTFDHASSLGRELLDTRIDRILCNADGVSGYVHKGPGAIYWSSTGHKGENPLELVRLGHRRYPHLFDVTLARLRVTPLTSLQALVDRVPPGRMSPAACRFVKSFLAYTYGQLCNLAV